MQTVFFSDTDSSRSPRHKQAPAEAETTVLAGKRVVIVEDEGITQLQLRKILTREGLNVVGAAMSGSEGVAVILREQPDLVLMDIQMPGAYDGLEAARRILAERSVCIVMLTAFSDERYRDQARQVGACGYVVKPVDKETLLPQLEAAFKAYRPQ